MGLVEIFFRRFGVGGQGGMEGGRGDVGGERGWRKLSCYLKLFLWFGGEGKFEYILMFMGFLDKYWV